MLDRSTVLVSSMGVSLVLTFLYGSLYTRENKRYMLYWCLSFAVVSLAYVTALVSYESRFFLIMDYLSTVTAASLIYYGTQLFLEKQVPDWWVTALGINASVFCLAMVFGWSEIIFFFPAAIWVSAMYIQSGASFMAATRLNRAVRETAGLAYFFWGLTVATYPLWVIGGRRPPAHALMVAGVAGLMVAFSLLTAYYQQVREGLLDREREMNNRTQTDRLTGLYNRNYFEEMLHQMDHPAFLPLSMVVGDVNGLKLSNDVFGHLSGDRLLVKAAEILRGTCRGGDVLVRWGGDEFVLLLPRTEHRAANRLVERVKEGFARASQGSIPMDISLGVATRESMSQDLYAVFRSAEAKMYKNKQLESKVLKQMVVSYIQADLQRRDPSREGHVAQVCSILCGLGSSLGMGVEQVYELSLVASLYDSGRITLPSERTLTPSSQVLIAESGYQIAKNCGRSDAVAEAILHQYERWDGAGVPRGLMGERIPLYSRLLALSEGMAQALGRGLTPTQAIQALRGERGRYDPQLLGLLIPQSARLIKAP